MTTMNQLTRQGIDALRSGQSEAGRVLLVRAVTANPRDTLAWLWLATIAPNTAEKRRCLEQVLKIDPDHAFARRDLAALGQAAPTPRPEPPQSNNAPKSRPAEVLARPELTVDDTVAIARHNLEEDCEPQKSKNLRRLQALLLLGLLLALLLVGQSVLQAIDRPSEDGASTALTDTSDIDRPADRARPAEDAALPATVFLDGRLPGAVTPATALIALLPDTGMDEGEVTCMLPHGTAVLLLESRVANTGGTEVRVKHRECAGWVPQASISEQPLEIVATDRRPVPGLAEK